MKKALLLASVLVFAASASFAANPFDEFRNQISGVSQDIAQKNLDNFAKDLGALMGGGAAHQGKTLGIPGFDVGVHVPVQKTNTDNAIVKAAGIDTMALPIAQVEIGLPAKIDVIARGTSYTDASMFGAGLRYGLLKNSLPGIPSISVQAIYNTLSVNAGANKFNASTISASASLSFNLPIVTPYATAGIDSTTVDPDSTISGLQGKATGTRLEAGVNLSLFPLTYVQLGGGYVNGELGYTAGFGIKF